MVRVLWAALLASFVSTVAVPQPEGAFISDMSDLRQGQPNGGPWFISDFARRSQGFVTAWRQESVRLDHGGEGALALSLVPATAESDKAFFGGEVQRRRRTHYGRYEVVMTPARGDGVISSFFTYTGPYFGDPHDEIDFEFLGRDTTKVWLNRFAAGERLPGRWIDLGFDAADGPHLYAFEWHPDRLVWWADGRELLRLTADETVLPTIPGRIYINIWGGAEAQRQWSGVAPSNTRAEARYYCISYRPPGSSAPMCSDREDAGNE